MYLIANQRIFSIPIAFQVLAVLPACLAAHICYICSAARLRGRLANNLKSFGYILAPVIMCFTLAGCSVLGPVKTATVNNYTLTPSFAQPLRTAPSSRVILVSSPTAAPGYQSAEMVYTRDRYQLNSFAVNRWVAPPAAMLQPLLLQALQQSGCFRAVVAPPFAGIADIILDTRILVLQQEFIGKGSQVYVALQSTALNSHTGQVLSSRQWQLHIPAMTNTPYGGVLATNQAVTQLLADITQQVCKR